MRTYLVIIPPLLFLWFSLSGQTRKENLDSVVKSLKLKEVVVSARKIKQRGDTISYSAATYRSKNDRTLSDLLRKMPGLEVKENGQVTYNGQWVKELYIEGMNMLGDNYGVATNNIDAKSIGTVQVMENHQSVKMLQGVEKGTAPAINIKLKEDAKGVWTANAEGAVGCQPEFSWDFTVNLMNFRRKAQNISVYKTDNVGSDLRKEIGAPQTFTSSLGVSLLSPGKPSLDNRLSYRNTSHSLTVNQLFRVRENNFLTFNVNYLYDREKRDTENVTTYLTDSVSRYVFSELNTASIRQHFIGLNSGYKINGDNTYLKNTLTANISFPKGEGMIGEELHQSLSGHSISLRDVFEFKHRRIGGGIGDATARFTYNERDGMLRVPEHLLSQRLRQRNLVFGGSTSLMAFSVPHVMFNLNFGFDIDHQNIRAFLDKGGSAEDGGVCTWKVLANLRPRILVHNGQSFQWSLNLPIGIIHYKSSEWDWKYNRSYLSLKPSTYISYKLSDRWSITAIANLEEELPSALSLLAEKYYTNYRTTMSNPRHVEMKPDRKLKGSLSAGYKSVLDMMFGNISLSYALCRYGTSSGYEILDGIVNYERIPESTRTSLIQFDQTFSKGFFRGNSKISEELSVTSTSGTYYVKESLHTGRNIYLRGKLGYRSSFTAWISFDTSNELTLTKTYTDGISEGKIRNTFTNITSLIVWPLKNLSVQPSVMYYHNNYYPTYRDNVFLNCKIEYSLREVVFSIHTTNLLDNRVFRRFSDNGIVSRSNEYRLRGRTVMFGVRLRLF